VRFLPETADRADWPRLVAQAVNALIRNQDAGGGTSLELDGGDVSGPDGSIEVDGGGA